MSKILLVHGFGIGINSYTAGSEIAGFHVFDKLIIKGEAKVFNWSIDKNIESKLHVNKYIELYFNERQKAFDKDTILSLYNFYKQNRFEVIIAHSLGAQLVQNLCRSFAIKARNLILIQADIDRKSTFQISAEKKVNFYSYLDNALIVSQLINHYKPAGLYGISTRDFLNIHFMSFQNINLHKSMLEDTRFFKEIEKYF